MTESEKDIQESREYSEVLQKFNSHQFGKLWENRHKGRWEELNPLMAFKLMIDEASELLDAVLKGEHPINVWRESADVSNFAMMMADTHEKEYYRKLEQENQLAANSTTP